jgi:hypothetical protein
LTSSGIVKKSISFFRLQESLPTDNGVPAQVWERRNEKKATVHLTREKIFSLTSATFEYIVHVLAGGKVGLVAGYE